MRFDRVNTEVRPTHTQGSSDDWSSPVIGTIGAGYRMTRSGLDFALGK
jgi:hypothetical protein